MKHTRFGSTTLLSRHRVMPMLAAAALAVGVMAIAAPAQAATPAFQMPFTCGYWWPATTYPDHQSNAIDWNIPGTADFGRWVRAGASGYARGYYGSTGYGNHVIVTHADGWTSLYAHLSTIAVPSGGMSVSRLTKVGEVGSTGNSTGPHLHHEQRLYGVRQPIRANGVRVYPGNSYQSANC